MSTLHLPAVHPPHDRLDKSLRDRKVQQRDVPGPARLRKIHARRGNVRGPKHDPPRLQALILNPLRHDRRPAAVVELEARAERRRCVEEEGRARGRGRGIGLVEEAEGDGEGAVVEEGAGCEVERARPGEVRHVVANEAEVGRAEGKGRAGVFLARFGKPVERVAEQRRVCGPISNRLLPARVLILPLQPLKQRDPDISPQVQSS